MALLIFVLKLIEYQFVVRDVSVEVLVFMLAIIFVSLGIWAGKKWNMRPRDQMASTVAQSPEDLLIEYGISTREFEVLQLMAQGLSNQQIADQLYISLNTVKTHSSNLFVKLDVKRRTQAIRVAQDLQLL